MLTDGVSVVVPVRNGARWLPDVLAAVLAECAGRVFEVLVIDDGSEDGSRQIATGLGARQVRVIDGPRRGAAAAVNAGVRASRFPFIAQIDQDVVVRPGWLSSLMSALADPAMAAAQGWYVRDPAAPLLARVMALDLEQRYASIEHGNTDHVCTGNVVWRRAAFEQVGGLDETLGYGYDNDLSYRLVAAGWQLTICQQARSYHRWREDWPGYVAQQYGFGYGRLDLLARHPQRLAGDRVSPGAMMAHPLVLIVALALMAVAVVALAGGGAARVWALVSALLVGSLVFERSIAGLRAFRRSRDRAALMFPVAHLARDLAWVAAIVMWVGRRAAGGSREPRQSMQPRVPGVASPTRTAASPEIIRDTVADGPESSGQ